MFDHQEMMKRKSTFGVTQLILLHEMGIIWIEYCYVDLRGY